MAFRPHATTPLLYDGASLWCANCRKPIFGGIRNREEQRHFHHVDQTWLTDDLSEMLRTTPTFPVLTEYQWREWVVPTHGACHASLDAYSRHVAEGVLGARTAPKDQVEAVATECFITGDYAVAVRLRQCLRYHYTVNYWNEDEQRRHLQFEQAVAAGLWFFRDIPLVEFLKRLPDHLRPEPRRNPGFALFLMNPPTTICGYDIERIIRDFTDTMPAYCGDELKAKVARLLAVVTLNPKDADEALRRAENAAGLHQVLTAQLAQAWGLFANEEPGPAYDLIKEADESAAVSWWHRFQLIFTRACLHIICHGDSGLRHALGLLFQAQLVMITKGLRGWAIPDVRISEGRRRMQLYPGHVIEWLVNKYGLSKEFLDEVRRESIKKHLVDALWTPPHFPWRPAITAR